MTLFVIVFAVIFLTLGLRADRMAALLMDRYYPGQLAIRIIVIRYAASYRGIGYAVGGTLLVGLALTTWS